MAGPNGEACKKCYFYEQDKVGTLMYYCMRFPPLPKDGDTESMQQPVIDDDHAHETWCGEFKPMSKKDEKPFQWPQADNGKLYTTAEAAAMLNQHEWRIRRLFTDGTIPEPRKFGGKRVISDEIIPRIAEKLRERNWLPIDTPSYHESKSVKTPGGEG